MALSFDSHAYSLYVTLALGLVCAQVGRCTADHHSLHSMQCESKHGSHQVPLEPTLNPTCTHIEVMQFWIQTRANDNETHGAST